MDYKKNFVKFELERFEKIKQKGYTNDFFLPLFNETQWITESPRLIGIVDRIHRCFKDDVFAPKHPDFKDGDLVIVENKTGKPTFEKCKGYKKDGYWYKILIEIEHPELAPINWYTIYFPYDNYPHHFKLENDECRILAKEIHEVRQKIINCIENDEWIATPDKEKCKWCDYKNICEFKV
jgi:hypothetical protein